MRSSISLGFRSRLLIGLLAGLLSLSAVLPLHAGFIDGEQKLVAADGAADDQFGCAVSVSGNYAVVGAYRDDDKGKDSGAAYVFKRNPNGSWSQQAKLTANDGAAEDLFGNSVSISGDYVIVGAEWNNSKGETSGAAYIFKRNLDESWVQQAKLTASDGAGDDSFGTSVSISGDYAIVGAYDDNNEKGADAGSAYIFRRNSDGSWTEQAKLTADDGVEGDEFGEFVSISGDYTIVSGGYAVYIFKRKDGLWIQQKKLTPDDGCFGEVSISGNYAIVGDYCDDDKGEFSGAAYIFRRNSDESWTQQAKLISDDGAEGDYFGNAVSISGDYAVVGAWQHDDKGENSGAVYIFKRNPDGSWIQQKKLTSDDGAANDCFGVSASVSGDNIFVGANGDDDTLKGTDSGSVYVYDARMAYKITPGDGAADDNFGNAVAISGDYAIIGAYWDDNRGLEDSGAAYIFRRNPDGSWTQQAKLAPDDGNESDYFGNSVSISGDYAIVGSPEHDDIFKGYDSGAAYIYKRNPDGSWTQQTKLTAKDGIDSDYFGYSVSISGDYAVISASGEDSDSESVYIFRRNPDGSWTQQTKLSATGRTEDDDFGNSVSISGDYVVVGSPGDGNGRSGAAYIFKRNPDGSWTQQTKLFANDLDTDYDGFGNSVSISGDYVLIGASGDSDDLGAAYIFKRNSDGEWTQQTKFVGNDSEFYDGYFGCSVAISGDYAVVGAYEDDDKGDDSGSAYIFRRNPDDSWTQHKKLFAKDSAKEDYFGCSVAISGDYVLAGACGDDDKGLDSGSAYFFQAPFQSSSVTVKVKGNGTVSPDGVFFLGSAHHEFTFTPYSHYQISSVLVDGKPVGAESSYIFSDTLTDHTLEATFVTQTLTLTVSKVGTGYGDITPNTWTPSYGSDLTVTATPHENSTFDGWNGDIVSTENTITLENITSDKTITATFTLKDLVCLPPQYLALDSDDDTGISDTDGLTRNTSDLTVTGFGEDGATVQLYDGDTPIAGATALVSEGQFAIDISLSEGKHAVKAKQTDAAGNESGFSDYLYIITDITPPEKPDVGMSGATPTRDTTPTWTWFSRGGGMGIYRWKLNDSNMDAGATESRNTTQFTPDSPLPEGTYTLHVRECDQAGNWSEPGSFTVAIDTTADPAPEFELGEGATTPTRDTTPTWKWKSGGGTGVYQYKLGENSAWSSETEITEYTPPGLSDRTHTLYVREKDAAGNWSPAASHAVIVDTGKPCSEPTSPPSVNAEKKTFEITYDANDIYEGGICGSVSSGSGLKQIELYVKAPGAADYTLAATDTGSGIDRKFSFSASEEGMYVFYTRATDNAGNIEDIPAKGWDTQTVYISQFSGYAIIGVGSVRDNEGIEAHTLTANNIYTHLISRGFALVKTDDRWDDPLDHIKYFNPYGPLQPGEDDYAAEGVSYTGALRSALTEWAPAKMKAVPGPLFVILINHGSPDTFYLTGEQPLFADVLKGWLGTLQANIGEIMWKNPATGENEPPPIVVLLGACYSGSFIDDISAPGRIVVTASAAGEPSYRGPGNPYGGARDGEFFTNALFNALGAGLSLKAGFESAVTQTETHTDSGTDSLSAVYHDTARQHPLLEDNSDGKGSNNLSISGSDGRKSEHIFLGMGTGDTVPAAVTRAGTDPETPPGMPYLTTQATLWAEVSESAPGKSEVWAEIRRPGMILEQGSGAQQTVNLESVKLTWNADENHYSATYSDFTEPGPYKLFFYVKDISGIISPFINESKTDISENKNEVVLYKAKASDDSSGGSGPNPDLYGDANGDGKIGLEELVYILRKLTGR